MTFTVLEWDSATKTQKERPSTPTEDTHRLKVLSAAVPVPSPVTMRQAKLALFQAGKLAAVEEAIDAMDEPDRTVAGIEWREATEVKRDWPLVVSLTPLIGTEEDVDNLFRLAATL